MRFEFAPAQRISSVDDWEGIEEFAKDQEVWLRNFLELPNGIPYPFHNQGFAKGGLSRPGIFWRPDWVGAASRKGAPWPRVGLESFQPPPFPGVIGLIKG